MRRSTAILIVILAVGIAAIGRMSQPSPSPSPVIKTERHTVTKEVKVKTPYVPQRCVDMEKLAEDLESAVSAYEAALGSENRITSEASTAILDKDFKALNDVADRQRKQRADTLDKLLEINEIRGKLREASKVCRLEVGP